MYVSVVLLLLASVALSSQEEDSPSLKIPLGGIRGTYKVSHHGRRYQAYEGIPYALPPVGKLRFKPPQRTPPWTGELQATRFGAACLQYHQIPQYPPDRLEGAEDCLYLNVYVPERENAGNNPSLMPVVFWIHGGCFQYGSGKYMGEKFLMDRDVVYVSINYRLGPLGFLSTEDEVVPGNMGLKDQNMALRWVSENIEWFGGNPRKVTLAGLSAGGASVHYHYLSPLSTGLFHAGISYSGTAFDAWTQTENASEKAKKMGALMGCPTNSNREMIRCLRYRPAHSIIHATEAFQPWLYNPFTPFGPVPERVGDAPFINRPPAEIVNSGDVADVPWITGVTSEEGLFPVAEFIADNGKLKELEENWDLIAPHLLHFNYTLPKEKHAEVARQIKKHYFGSKPIDRMTVKPLIQMAGDRLFVVDSEKAARMQARVNQSPVYYHYFTYRGAHSLSEAMSHTSENFGVSHGDDALLVLDTPFVDPTSTQQDREMQQDLLDLWVSVAETGIPRIGNIDWSAVDPSGKEFPYMHIAGPGKYSMETDANLGEKQFWNSIDFRENKVKRSTGSTKDEF